MPELPDVEVFRKYLNRTSLHRSIDHVEVKSGEILEDISERSLRSHVKGDSFDSTARHGKYLFARLHKNGWLVFHFGMTGYFNYLKNEKNEPDNTRVRFDFNNGYHLAFVLQRKLGRISLAKSVDDRIKSKG